jgi:Spy/CpxP family protein refolding chaperone
MNEMIKFREENMAKMQSMMVEHRKKMMNLLTDEQKKYLDGGREAEPPTEKK